MEQISVLIPDGESDFAMFVIHGFMDIPQVKLYVLSGQPWAPARFSRNVRKFIYHPTGADYQRRLEVITHLAQQFNINVLLPVETDWIKFIAATRALLPSSLAVAPVPDLAAFEIVNNKWLLAKFMEEHQIPGPPTLLGTLDDEFNQQLTTLKFPVLIKPVTAWGGEGIHLFEKLADFQQFLTGYGLDRFKNRYIVQTLLTGYVVGLNVLCQNGQILAYTMQRGMIANTRKWAAAAAIKFIKQEGVLDAAQKLLTALNWSGFGNLDMFFDTTDNQIKILELNARFWGSLRGSYVAGVNFPYLACLAALNTPFPVPDYQLVQYVHPKTTIKLGLAKLLGKNESSEFVFNETGLKFLIKDPLAEMIRAFRQETSKERWQ